MRDNDWLEVLLNDIRENYFSDVEFKNQIIIGFGRWAKYQFGVISFDRKKNISKITINRMFVSESVPENIVRHTIAHELVHYSHGFSSTLKRLHRHPHHGGVVNKDLVSRGLEPLLIEYKVWLKTYRKSFAANKLRP